MENTEKAGGTMCRDVATWTTFLSFSCFWRRVLFALTLI